MLLKSLYNVIKHLASTHAHEHAGKEFAWFQRSEKSTYQFSTIELTTNVALKETLPTIALSQQSLLAHRADHYGTMVAWWDFPLSVGYLTALLSHPVTLIWCFQYKYIVLQGFWKGSVYNVSREQLNATHRG